MGGRKAAHLEHAEDEPVGEPERIVVLLLGLDRLESVEDKGE